jgi:hypothetical protein
VVSYKVGDKGDVGLERRVKESRKYHAPVCAVDALLGALGDALVGAVAGFEEEGCGPVVAFKIVRNGTEEYKGL